MIEANTVRDGEVRVAVSGGAIELVHEFNDIVSMLLSSLSRTVLLEVVQEAEAFPESDEEEYEISEEEERRLQRIDDAYLEGKDRGDFER